MPAKHITRWRDDILDTVFPAQCLVCSHDELELQHGMCPSCDKSLARLCRILACPTCGRSVGKYAVSKELCRACRKNKPRVDATVCAGPYTDIIQPLMKAFKYQGQEDLLALFGPKMVDKITCASWLSRIEAVAIVPTHWRRRLRRPFYAPTALADYVSKSCHLPLAPILRRTRCGPHQIGLSDSARILNVHGAFALRSGVRLNKARILLIDDVKTTGATLDECARVLRRGGAVEVYAAVAAMVQSSPGDPVTPTLS